MSALSRRVSIGVLVAALTCTGMFSIAVPTAGAAAQWNNGTPAMSTQVKCAIDLQETGAIAEAGYLADPANPPKAGQVFWGHADFSATTDTACSSGDQIGQLDVVLPPGVSLAVDAAHPISCLYADNGGAQLTYPTCPTNTIVGAYGPEIPSDNAGHAWTMPTGREFDIRFPLISNRRLVGPGGGHCPQSVDEIATSPQRDCLLLALHLADGYSDPWLTPSVDLFIDPAATPRHHHHHRRHPRERYSFRRSPSREPIWPQPQREDCRSPCTVPPHAAEASPSRSPRRPRSACTLPRAHSP